ncbi:MAG: nuclear transport factor 2 family protein [Actinobacteria bacterium]|nr:nuclear transport factor 2 family protein [Actinomycetota bacterium]
MEESAAVRDAVLDFYRAISTNAAERFDELVSADPATLVVGTAPGEWVTERPRLRFGFEAEGLTIEPGTRPTGYREGNMGWFVDEPTYGFPGGGGMRTRLTAVVREEDGRWKIVHLHVSVGVPDAEVQELQARWGVA